MTNTDGLLGHISKTIPILNEVNQTCAIGLYLEENKWKNT